MQFIMEDWRTELDRAGFDWKPYLQSLYVDLVEEENAQPSPIHLGIRCGRKYLLTHLKLLESYGVNHVILNLKYGQRPTDEVIQEIGEYVLNEF